MVRVLVKLLARLTFVSLVFSGQAFADASMWQLVHTQKDGLAHRLSTPLPDLKLMPSQFQLYRVDESAMQRYLLEGSDSFLLSVPLPDGSMVELSMKRSSMIEQALADQHPELMTFEAVANTDPRISGTLDYTPKGFHGLLTTPQGLVYIDPRGESIDRYYVSYFQKDYAPAEKSGVASCGVDPAIHHEEKEAQPLTSRFVRELAAAFTTGDRLHEYRIAVAATAEYTNFHNDGNPQVDALAAIVSTINRVNFFLRRDFSAKLNVVADNLNIIFTNTSTDGFTHGNTSALLNQVQPIIDAGIGRNNYDIGHVFDTLDAGPFSTISQGIAYVGIVCDPRSGTGTNSSFGNRKGQGASASSNPIGDGFDVGLVAHEIGHQFGANHTFNSTRGTCGSARTGSSAVEPGSGSTLMSYPGSCGTDNLQNSSDYMFSSWNLEQVADEFNAGWGDLCDVATNEGNNEPSAIASGTYEIPAHTPFELTGAGVDADNGDVLTYSWEQTDRGSASSVNVDTGNNAIFRAFLPVDSATRTFPKLSSILTNSTSIGETLPTTTRQLNFRLTVRDQRGGTDDANVVVNVTDTDPSNNGFRITSQNTGLELVAGSSVNFTWNPVGTNAAPINCSSVEISFSGDGGQTFPTTVLAGTSNDGSALITVPAVLTNQGRFKLKCANNIFFDISDSNISIGNVPEIRINGNGQEINDGSTGLSAANNTLFGSISPNGTIDKTFQIQNLGTEALAINGSPRVQITGSGNFSVTNFPASSIAANGSDTFTIRFSASAEGTSDAIVRVDSNDGDESPYTFAIRGIVVGPEIEVRGSSQLIADGDSSPRVADGTNFGSVNVNTNSDNAFTITNTGAGTLQLTGIPSVSISGSHAGDFSVLSVPNSSTLPFNASSNFTIRFRPTAAGIRNASLSIANNDSNENPYNFSIRGTGIAADLTPTMLDNLDPVNPGESLQYSVTVNNNGPSTAQNVVATFSPGSNVTIVSTAGCAGSPAASPTCTLGSIPNSGSAVFTVNTVIGTGARTSVSSSVSVSSQTPDLVPGNNTDSELTSVVLVPPTFSLIAQPDMVLQNTSSTLAFTVNNSISNVAASSISVNLNLPAGLLVASPANVANTCSGSLVANQGQSQINFASGAVNAGQTCQFRVDVVSEEENSYSLVTSNLTSSSGSSGATGASLEVVEKLESEICFPISASDGKYAVICF